MNYSVAIRTLGTGGTKYQETLNSIHNQTIPPEEVIVFIPNDYELPVEKLGYEKFIRTEKGMVRQRIAAIDYVQTEYILLLDDDVSFPINFVESLYNLIQESDATVAVSKMEDHASSETKFAQYPKMLLAWKVKQLFTGNRFYTSKDKGYYKSIWRTGGVVYLTDLKPHKTYYQQTGHGSHCFGKTVAFKSIHFEEELWLEDTQYALPEDQVMFYKLHLKGYKIVFSQHTILKHLDGAKKSVRENQSAFASGRNFLIFWYRFIYKNDKKIIGCILDIIAIHCRIVSNLIWYLIRIKIKPMKRYCSGVISAIIFILNYKDSYEK